MGRSAEGRKGDAGFFWRQRRRRSSPPCETIEPVRLDSPLIFSSPHSGRCYPKAFWRPPASTCTRCAARKMLRWTISSPPRRRMAHPCCARIFRAPSSTSIAKPMSSTRNCSTSRLPSFRQYALPAGRGRTGQIARVVAEGQAIYASALRSPKGLRRIERRLQALSRRAGGPDDARGADIRRRGPDRLPFHALAHADRRRPTAL